MIKNVKIRVIPEEITDYICGLELEDETGTQYMKDWFKILDYGDQDV